jgi:ABC-type phosphate/phosphonate transport system substrate-binding protein
MAMNEKLDPDLATQLRDFLKRNHIERKRIVIDIESETIELDAADDLDDILNAPPDFTPEEAERVIENIRRSREEWA